MNVSGDRWVGEVPSHWDLEPLGRIGRLFKGSGGNKEDEVPVGVPCVRYGDLYTRHEFFITDAKACVTEERAKAYTPIQYGDVLFAGSGETIDDIGRSAVNFIEGPACCGGDILVLRPKRSIHPRFLGYAADASPSRYQKACMGRGFTVVHLYGDELRRLLIPLPPPDEQAAIVRYLDYMDRRIRRYIRAKQRLIKLLEEEKQAIIHRAVTGQVDVRTGQPYPAYKPSGVEWLGDVPEEWEVRRLGLLARVFNGSTPSRMEPGYWEGDVAWLASGKVNDSVVTTASELVTSRALKECSISLVPKGSVIVGMVGQGKTRGKATLLGIDACINQNLAAVVPTKLLRGRFLNLYLKAFYHELREEGRGGNQAALNCDIIGRFPAPIASISEQDAVVRWVDEETAGLNGTTEQVRRQVALIQEYRTRLIADVVTGKLDVREAAAQLPDEPDDAESLDDVDLLKEEGEKDLLETDDGDD